MRCSSGSQHCSTTCRRPETKGAVDELTQLERDLCTAHSADDRRFVELFRRDPEGARQAMTEHVAEISRTVMTRARAIEQVGERR